MIVNQLRKAVEGFDRRVRNRPLLAFFSLPIIMFFLFEVWDIMSLIIWGSISPNRSMLFLAPIIVLCLFLAHRYLSISGAGKVKDIPDRVVSQNDEESV